MAWKVCRERRRKLSPFGSSVHGVQEDRQLTQEVIASRIVTQALVFVLFTKFC